MTADEAPLSERPREKPSRRLGLSGKLLLLTIPLVILAEILIYVPAIANFRMNRLNDRLAAANTAALVLDAAPSGTVPDSLARQILGSRIKYAADAYAAMDGADALLILTEWKEFSSLDLGRIKHLLRSPIVLDGRNVFSQAEMAEAGLSYFSVGRPALEVSRSLLKKGQSARQ